MVVDFDPAIVIDVLGTGIGGLLMHMLRAAVKRIIELHDSVSTHGAELVKLRGEIERLEGMLAGKERAP